MDPDPLFADDGEDFNWLEVDRAPPESDESEGEPLGSVCLGLGQVPKLPTRPGFFKVR